MSVQQRTDSSTKLPRLLLGAVLAVALFAACAPADEQDVAAPGSERAELSDEGPDNHVTYRPDTIEWQDGPGSLEPGSQVAVLEGDPSEAGVFTLRLRLPDGFVIAPHSHPGVERVTVISGIFRLGSGETVDPERTTGLEPGSYTAMPPGMVHYAIADGETVIQLTSVGPWELSYVNPEDDPRER